MLRTKSLMRLLLMCLLLSACRRKEGINKEPIFKNNPPESRVYQSKLADLIIADDDALSYYIKGYAIEHGHDFLLVTVSGPDLLATAYIQINDPKGIEDIVVKHANGYVGAELEGLKLQVTKIPTGAVLLYQSVENILD
ncbi:MAG: hypothetical protein RL427_1074 [Bacteroidota bacterium]